MYLVTSFLGVNGVVARKVRVVRLNDPASPNSTVGRPFATLVILIFSS